MSFVRIATVDAVHTDVVVEALHDAEIAVHVVPLRPFSQLQYLRHQHRPQVDIEVEAEREEDARAILLRMEQEAEEAVRAQADGDGDLRPTGEGAAAEPPRRATAGEWLSLAMLPVWVGLLIAGMLLSSPELKWAGALVALVDLSLTVARFLGRDRSSQAIKDEDHAPRS